VEKGASVARRGRGFSVDPSPLNPLKLELGIALLLAPVVWLLAEHYLRLPLPRLLVVLGGYGFAAALWLVIRVRRRLGEIERDGA